ncbi:MAG: transketolase C-terminal domain-containing protein [Acidobacteriota bacterium]
MHYTEAVDSAIAQKMVEDNTIILLGEDLPLLRRNLLVRFGPERIIGTPISENAFTGAGVSAAMSGLRPIVELYMVDFVSVAMDPILNHAAKLETFSGGKWPAPIIIRMPCGGGYGDGGQHEQSLWGWLAHIPGIDVVVPSTPADAGGLMLQALQQERPVVFLEHKLFSRSWIEFLGSGGRKNMKYDIPADGSYGNVPEIWEPVPFGKAAVHGKGEDITIVSVGVGVHRAIRAREILKGEGISASVIDLRTLNPLDKESVRRSVKVSGRLLVVDEDYEGFGLSGELSAVVAESGIPFKFARVCTRTSIPYSTKGEKEVLPDVDTICSEARKLYSL